MRSNPASGPVLTEGSLLWIPIPLSLPLTHIFSLFFKNKYLFKKKKVERLGGSVCWASDFSSGHDLTVCEFESRVGLCADSSEPGARFRFCVSLPLCPSPTHALSLSKINIKKLFLHVGAFDL